MANLFVKLTKNIKTDYRPMIMKTRFDPSAALAINNWTLSKRFFLSPAGLSKLKQEYESFKKLKLLKSSGETPQMMESEDLNSDYLAVKEDIDLLDAKLAEIEAILKNARLIKTPPKEMQDIVDLGATVAVEVNGQKTELQLVGCLEADPDTGRISNESPVGQALLGHRAGEEVALPGAGKAVYKIKAIKYRA